jgi:Uma2 family endonuclease
MATVVPGTRTATSLENGDALYEVVNGQRVQLSMGAYESTIASDLHGFMSPYARTKGLGRAVVEVLFLLTVVGTKRRPDVAFVSYERWPRRRRVPREEAWEVVPDLAVEVVSPSNTAEEILTKIEEYFRAGAKRVWVIYPSLQQVYVYVSPTQNHILSRSDRLDGEDILPGFELPVSLLFDEAADE